MGAADDEKPDDGAGPRRSLRHELRTPLNQIIGYSELLAEEAQDTGQDGMLPDLEKIGLAARNMLGLIDRLFQQNLVQPLQGMTSPGEREVTQHRRVVLSDAEQTDEEVVPAATVAGRRVMVVDDDPQNVDFLARQLHRRGYKVEVAFSGQKALAMIDESPPDLVLLDVMMPGMSGIEVLQTVRKTRAAADLPIIMATALDQSGDVVEALRCGANDYVTKPLDLPVVLARLENQLALKQAREQIQQLARDLEGRNRLIRSAFGRFLDEDVVTTLLETPEGLNLGGSRRTVTVMMTDLRGFTAMADRLSPDEVMAALNDYLGAMVDVIARHGGTIIEFIGDAIFVVFGAPLSQDDDARRAVACAIEMQGQMDTVNARLSAHGLPQLDMGIALNTGEVIAGNIGSLKRSKYGVVGRHVNLTARIESWAVGGQILASAMTAEAAGADVEVTGRTSVRAKGFAEPVEIVEIRGLRDAGLRVPERVMALTALKSPLKGSLTVVEGKFLGGEEHEVALVQAGPAGALLACSGLALSPLTDVRLRIAGPDGALMPDDVYGKVQDVSADGAKVRFTSVPPAAAAHLRALAS